MNLKLEDDSNFFQAIFIFFLMIFFRSSDYADIKDFDRVSVVERCVLI